MNSENNGRGKYGERSLPIRAWRIARDEGFWSLIDQIVPSWLPSIHAHLPSDFNSMNDILRWLTRHSNYDVYSFDFFDTLLRRRIDPPELVKCLAAEYVSASLARKGINVGPNEVLAQRSKIEEALLSEPESGGRDADYCLDDVIAGTLKAIKAERVLSGEQIVNYEIGLEKEAAQPMPGAVEVLSYLKSIGKRVICISDSYLSTSQMAAILEHHGLATYIDKFYVSSDIGKRKSTGRLFRHVLENEGSKLVHIGDNYASDYMIPKRLGIKALWLHSRSEQRRKKELRKLRNSPNKLNYVNLIVRSVDRDSNELYRIGYEVLGPALTVFVHNVIEQAQKDGIEMLFFIARDGYVMKKIYETLQRTIYVESALPPGKYMCLGRLPVRLASLDRLTSEEVSEIHRYMSRAGRENINLRDLLSSYGLEPRSFMSISRRYGMNIDEPIHEPDRDTKLNELLESNEFQDIIRVQRDESRKLLRAYLLSLGFMGEHNVAIADANAEGVTKSLLEHAFVNDKDFPIVHGYYFNLLNLGARKVDVNLDLSQVEGIISDWRRDSVSDQIPFRLLGMLIEIFAHPNHGVTVGYKNVDGKTRPVFRKTPQESQYGMTSQGLEGILSYAKDYSTYYLLHTYRAEELLEHLKNNIKHWVLHPPKRDVEILKNLFLTSDWPQETNYSLTERIKVMDLIGIRRLRDKIESSMWPQGTLALAPVPNRLFYKTIKCGSRVCKPVSNLARLWSHHGPTAVKP